MRAKRPEDKSQLQLAQGFFADARSVIAHHALVQLVFGDDDTADPDANSASWWPFATFDPSGRCIASLEVRRLPVLIDGAQRVLAGLRRVAVHPDWRGLGLFRDLMSPALRWCEARTDGPILLFTEEPELYGRFGFALLPQHAVIGDAPALVPAPAARRVDPRDADGAALIQRLLAARAPVSRQVGLSGAPDLVWHNIRVQDFEIFHAGDLDVVVLVERNGEDLVLVDIIGAAIPSMTAILSALGSRPRRVTTLFPPDLLDWSGQPELDDTGLMACGPLPPAMVRPFMLPPTAEF